MEEEEQTKERIDALEEIKKSYILHVEGLIYTLIEDQKIHTEVYFGALANQIIGGCVKGDIEKEYFLKRMGERWDDHCKELKKGK